MRPSSSKSSIRHEDPVASDTFPKEISRIYTASNRENPHQEHVLAERGGWSADVGALRSAGAKARVEPHADGGARRFFSKAP